MMNGAGSDEPGSGETARVRDARGRSAERLRDLRRRFRPLGAGIVAIVIASTADGHPSLGSHGSGPWLTAALVVWVAGLAVMLSGRSPRGAKGTALIALIGACGVVIAAFQHRGATEIPASVAVWLAVTRLALGPALVLSAGVTAGLGVAMASTGQSGQSILAAILLCVLLGVMAHSMRLARESQDRAELLVAALEDAREEQARAAAVAERARIAGELHDVLAHSLSGAAIQLQGARMLAERADAPSAVREAIDRSAELVRAGLMESRRAVATLRGAEPPGARDISGLVQRFGSDMHVRAELIVEGEQRPLSPDADLAVYRAAQEALTNVARYAPAADVVVRLRYGAQSAGLTVENQLVPTLGPARAALSGVGGGHGLAGMRERVEGLGGRMNAGPRDAGWVVELELPA